MQLNPTTKIYKRGRHIIRGKETKPLTDKQWLLLELKKLEEPTKIKKFKSDKWKKEEVKETKKTRKQASIDKLRKLIAVPEIEENDEKDKVAIIDAHLDEINKADKKDWDSIAKEFKFLLEEDE